jgi:hypothetical protein
MAFACFSNGDASGRGRSSPLKQFSRGATRERANPANPACLQGIRRVGRPGRPGTPDPGRPTPGARAKHRFR